MIFMRQENKEAYMAGKFFNEQEELPYFCLSPSGIVGTYTEEYELISSISECSDAESQYLERISPAEVEKSLYALAGLKLIGSAKYEEGKAKLGNIESMVEYSGGGCMFAVITVAEVIKKIDDLAT